MTQTIGGKVEIGSLTFGWYGPVQCKSEKLLFEALLLRQILADLQQFHGYQAWQTDRRGSLPSQPGNRGWMAAQNIDHDISVQQHGFISDEFPPAVSNDGRILGRCQCLC